MLDDKIMELFLKGEPSTKIAKLFGCSSSHVSKTIRRNIEEGKYEEISKEEQIKLIEIRLFKKIAEYHKTKSINLVDEIRSLQNAYSTFII